MVLRSWLQLDVFSSVLWETGPGARRLVTAGWIVERCDLLAACVLPCLLMALA